MEHVVLDGRVVPVQTPEDETREEEREEGPVVRLIHPTLVVDDEPDPGTTNPVPYNLEEVGW